MDEIENKIKNIWAKMKTQGFKTAGEKCPDDAQLSYYLDGVLSAHDKENMEKHILQCNNCLNLILLNEKVKAHEAVSEVPAGWVERVKNLLPKKGIAPLRLFDIVLKFAKDTIEIIRNPANLSISYGAMPASVRGEKKSANFIILSKTFSDVKSEIEIELADNNHVHIKVLTTSVDSGLPVRNLRISIFNPDQEIASYVAENGEVYFTDLEFDKYIIKITGQSKKIGEISMDLKK